MANHQSSVEFVISAEKISILKENVGRVRTLFGVEVSLTGHVNPHDRNQWVCLAGASKELREKAKTYVTSLCTSKSKRCVDCDIPPSVFEDLKNGSGRKDIEKNSGAVLSFDDSKPFLQGEDIPIALALSEIEHKIAAFGEQKQQSETSAQRTGSDDVEHDAENTAEGSTCDTRDIPPSMRGLARKLLYKDEEIDAVIKTFGTEINFNKLLNELVKYSASTHQLSPSLEDASMLPIARGSYPSRRNLVTRGVSQSVSARNCELREVADQHVKSLQADNLRPIVIDGSNVAMHHGNQQIFSCRGIKICVEFFLARGHNDITVFVPMWRSEKPRPESPITEQEILEDLARRDILKFTPSRWSGNRHIVCYDDNFIVGLAEKNKGIVVSNDSFRDLHSKNPLWRETIDQRTLGYIFCGDLFMPADDPLGRWGPSLDDFLRRGSATHPFICPHLKNCTFGNKCRYYHPERDTQHQREKSPMRNSPENPEPSSTCSAGVGVKTSMSQSPSNSHLNSVRDPRVSSQPQVEQPPLDVVSTISNSSNSPKTASSLENTPNRHVRDPRVSIPTYQSRFDHHTRPHDIVARGRGQVGATGSSYDSRTPQFSGKPYYPAYFGGNVYSDYSHPVASDYSTRHLQYQDHVYRPELTQFPPLPPAQWLPYPQHQFLPPVGTGYFAGTGQCSYRGAYYEPAQGPYDNFKGLRPRDQVDSGTKSEESCTIHEQFDSIVEKFEEVFELDKETVIRVLLDHPIDFANDDIHKLADLFVHKK